MVLMEISMNELAISNPSIVELLDEYIAAVGPIVARESKLVIRIG